MLNQYRRRSGYATREEESAQCQFTVYDTMDSILYVFGPRPAQTLVEPIQWYVPSGLGLLVCVAIVVG
jgi:hypothetical protein